MIHFKFVKVDTEENTPAPIPADDACVYPYGFYVFTASDLSTFFNTIQSQAPSDGFIYEVRTKDGILAYKKSDRGYKVLIKDKKFLH